MTFPFALPSSQDSTVTRRGFLEAGTTGAAGLTISGRMPRNSVLAASSPSGGIRSCITIFLVGSPGHLDTWDMKPEAPLEIRGPFRPIDTNVPGVQIGEHFPRMARMMDKIALIRSLHHPTGATHGHGQRWMMTGRDFSSTEVFPHLGSVASHVLGNQGPMPANVILPGPIGNTGSGPLHGQTAGFLGREFEPWLLGFDPAARDFQIGDASRSLGTQEFRQNARRSLLHGLDPAEQSPDGRTESMPRSDSRSIHSLDFAAQAAFALSEEDAELRERYGRNTLGQSCLMARRLVERGCRCVTINQFDTVFNVPCWDMHADSGELNSTFADYERQLCPQFDRAYSALVEDLEQRGLLGSTLVCVLSEMGRTPRINPNGGRDHHPEAWTNFFAGGPVRGGQVLGATDQFGLFPTDNPIQPPQVLASIYHSLGIDLSRATIPGPDGRPMRLVDAQPIAELF